MSKIIQLTAENVKRLRAVHITPQGHLVVVGGQNEQGKSSLLDSIAMALGGTKEMPAVPVRVGESRASIILETEDLIIRRTFTSTGGTNLVVENREGLRYSSPQEVLNKFTGKFTFDPVSWMRAEPKVQLDTLKKITGLDFTTLDEERRKLYERRTTQNGVVDRMRIQSESMPAYTEAPDAPVDTAALMDEFSKANWHNSALNSLKLAAEAAGDDLADLTKIKEKLATEIADALARVERLRATSTAHEAKMEEARKKLSEASEAVAKFVPIDVAPARLALANATTTNQQVEANARRKAWFAELSAEKLKAEALTDAIEDIDQQKKDALAKTKFPVAKLSLGDDGIVFNGLPLEQASGAAKLRVAVAISAAANPKLRVMLIRDGSLLDDDNMELLKDLAAEHDLQVWIERVGTDKHVQVIIEDGSVVGPVEEQTADLPLS